MIRKIIEGTLTWLPEVSTLDIPKSLPAGISIHLRSGIIGLESQGIVGAIPLRNGDTIQIIPKIGEINFLRLLFRTEGKQTALEREFNDFVRYSITDEKNIDALVARQLLICLDEILHRSPLQRRKRNYRNADYVTGEIQAVKTTINLETKRSYPIVSIFKQRIKDIPENRLLTEALLRAWQFLSVENQVKYKLIYNQWFKKFSRSQDIFQDLLAIDRMFATNGYGGSRDYYRRALMLAKIILGSSGIDFGAKDDISGDAILLNAANIFEKYIRSVICDAYLDKGYIVTKGSFASPSLYTDGSFELIPDIIISRNKTNILIADVKYKKPTSGDHYQMAAYLTAHNLNRGLLLAPLFAGNSVVIKEFMTTHKIVVREIYLPMNDLNATEEVLSSLVELYSH